MKKILLTIAALFLGAAAWAQYQGTTWGADPEVFKIQKGLTPNKTESGYKYCTEPKLMLGQPSELYYIFENNKLAGISYAVDYSEAAEKKLLDNLSGFKFKKESEGSATVDLTKKQADEIINNRSLEILTYNDVTGVETGMETLTGYILNSNEPNAKTRAYVYKFLEHSKIYILSNILDQNKIVVVYVPQTEDF